MATAWSVSRGNIWLKEVAHSSKGCTCRLLKILTRVPSLGRDIALKVGERLAIGDGNISGIYSGGGAGGQ